MPKDSRRNRARNKDQRHGQKPTLSRYALKCRTSTSQSSLKQSDEPVVVAAAAVCRGTVYVPASGELGFGFVWIVTPDGDKLQFNRADAPGARLRTGVTVVYDHLYTDAAGRRRVRTVEIVGNEDVSV